MNKYLCANCGKEFESKKPFMCGLEYIHKFDDGQSVPDILIYICNECHTQLDRAK